MSVAGSKQAGDPDIGPTAHYTAYVWKRLGLPHAELFATRQGAALYWAFFLAGEWTTRVLPGVPSMRTYLEYRHRLIDAEVEALQPDCLVELGAGLTRRSVTWAVQRDIPTIDVDLPPMIRVKQAAIDRAPASIRAALQRRWTPLPISVLAPDFADRLRAVIGACRRPVVVAEGLLSYLEPADRQAVLVEVAHALRETAGAFVCDLHTQTAQANVGRSAKMLRLAIRTITGRRRSLDPYPDETALLSAFREAGFGSVAIVEAREHAAHDRRLKRLHSPAHIVRAQI